jgi:hypothetical protein
VTARRIGCGSRQQPPIPAGQACRRDSPPTGSAWMTAWDTRPVQIRRGLDELRKYIPLPTTGEAEKAFTTYKNYLVQFHSSLAGVHGVGGSLIPSLVAEVRSAQKLRSVQRRKVAGKQREAIMKALTISWAKELQLRIPAAFDAQLLPHLIQGAGHLSYYAVFHGARALFLGSGQQFEPTHASALATLSTWVKDRKLFPAPWSVYVDGGPSRAAMGLHGLPAHAALSGSVHPLGSPSQGTVWDSLRMLLCTTRDRQIEERKAEWRKSAGKRKVPAAEASKICGNLPATALFSVLWRLRKRSDYADADAFLEGVATAYDAEQYQNAITDIVHSCLGIFETILVAYVGPDLYRDATERFLKQATGSGSEAVEERSSIILT